MRTTYRARTHAGLSVDEFKELVRQPYSQPTIALLLEKWFGYCLSGSHDTTEVRSLTGEPVDLEALFGRIQANAAFKSALLKAVNRLGK